MNLNINSYIHTITKNTPSEYSLLVPDIDLLIPVDPLLPRPLYNIYKVELDNSLTLQEDLTQIVISNTTYTITLPEGLYILEFVNYDVTNKYYTLIYSYEKILSCLLDITTNLICTDLCLECYPDWAKDSVVLLTADYFFNLMDSLLGIVEAESVAITSLSQLSTFTDDGTDMVKLANRLALYCDNCLNLKADCGC